MSEGVSFIQDLAIILLAATAGGWGARRLGLSPVVGYLFAGLLVGTPQITFLEVTDQVRIKVLSQIGLVFLMFSIGLGIRLKHLRELGMAPVVATVVTALLILTMGRFFGGLIGLNNIETLFFAAMLMVSSSAIIGKLLTETGLLHQRPGQLALSQTLLEDFVAVVMLTLLGSIAVFGQGGTGGGWVAVFSSLGQLAAFVVLFVITGLLLLPRIVRRISSEGSGELQVILICGLLFGLALLTVLAGYSLALGAFLCGVLISELPRSASIERSFSGMRDVFTAVFFVAVGMSIDLSQTFSALHLILMGTVLALVGRFIAATIAWLLVCEDENRALKAALFLTPIGEFSFIIAGLGVTSGAIPESFQIAAVGIAFLTSLIGPLMMRYSNGITETLSPRRFPRLRDAFNLYREFWIGIGRRGGSHLLWKLLRGRVWQVAREVVWITAVLLFARPLYTYLERRVSEGMEGWDWLVLFLPWYWLAILLLTIAPFIALLRNLDAFCMILADYLGHQSVIFRKLGRAAFGLLRVLVFGLVLIWIANLLPWELIEAWVLIALAVLTVIVMAIGWRHFIRWHRNLELELGTVFEEEAGSRLSNFGQKDWEDARREWGLQLGETRLPDQFSGAGMTIAELALRERTGATIVGVERQGWALGQPGPHTHLFPGDEVFLLGSNEQITAALNVLGQELETPSADNQMRRAILEPVRIPADCPLIGRSLIQLNWPRLQAVQVAGARRNGKEIANPGPSWTLEEGDELLLLGAESGLRTVREALQPIEPEEGWEKG